MPQFGDIDAKEHNSIGTYSKKVLLHGWDTSALAPVKIATDASGNVKIDPTNIDTRYLKLDQTTPQTTTGTFGFPDIKITDQQLGSPTYTTLGDYFNTIQSSGRISGMALSAHTPADGSLDISSGTGIVKTTNAINADTKFFDYAGGNVTLTDNALNYIYAYYDSGTGTVKVAATTNRTTIHDYDQFTIGRCYREGTDAGDITTSGTNIYNFYRRIHNRLVKRYGFAWASGSTLSEAGTRGLATTDGVWYIGNTEIDTTGHNSNTGGYSFETYYYNGSAWIKTSGVTHLGNTQYNNTASGLVDMTNNKWANYWVYLCPAGDIYVLYGQAQYNTLAEAQATQSPASTPNYVSSNTRLIARITFQKSATNFNAISNALISNIPSGMATTHNLLAGLDGGTTNEYYHLTNAEYGGNWGTKDWSTTGKGAFGKVEIDNSSTYIDKDGSGNMTFTDAVVGTRTLKQLGCPTKKKLIATGQVAGSLNLTYADWGISKAWLKRIRISVTSGSTTDFDVYIYEKDTFLAADKIYTLEENNSTNGVDVIMDVLYEDQDATSEIHLKIVDNTGTGSPVFSITIDAIELL